MRRLPGLGVAFSQTELLTVGGVLGLLFTVIVYNQMRAAKVMRAAHAEASGIAPAITGKPWPGRYLQHEGDILGQVMAVEGETVIVRKGATTLAVPRVQVREQGADLGLMGAFDAAAAERAGEAWKGKA